MFKLIPYRKNNLSKTEDVFDDFFESFFNDDFFAPMRNLETRVGGFNVDVSDQGDKYVIEADLPGMEKENVKIEYANKYLSIKARREESKEENKENYIRRERRYGECQRSFYIDNVLPEDVQASFKNGVLRIELKKKPLVNGEIKQIEIKD